MSIAAASGRPKAGAARLDLLAAIRKGKKLKKKADRPGSFLPTCLRSRPPLIARGLCRRRQTQTRGASKFEVVTDGGHSPARGSFASIGRRWFAVVHAWPPRACVCLCVGIGVGICVSRGRD